jgi:hypothetical protein
MDAAEEGVLSSEEDENSGLEFVSINGDKSSR